MGGAHRNPALRNHFVGVWIVKPSGCHCCTNAFGGEKCRGVPTPLRSTSQFSEPRIQNTNKTKNKNLIIIIIISIIEIIIIM